MTESGDNESHIAGEIARILDECRISQAIHPRKLKELSLLRSSARPPLRFFPTFARAITPLFDFPRRTASSERAVRFVSAFAAAGADDEFLKEFLRFLLVASSSGHRAARLRACQIVSEIIMRLPDSADVSDEVWDEVIDNMKQRIKDKFPAIRGFAVRALSRFANDAENGDIVNLLLQSLSLEQNSEVRKTIVLSMPPSNDTSATIVASTLDVSEAVRRAAYCVLASKFPLQSLSIKLRTTILQRGLSDRSSSVTIDCLKMLKDEWLTKCCGGDPIVLLQFLDVETYESVGEAVMECLLKDGAVRVQEGHSIRQYLTPSGKSEGGCTSGIQLMEPEIALYWKTLCRHLQTVAHAKGSEAANATGTEAAVYASEASDNNDLLEGILPVTVSDYVELVKAHLSAGPNYHFASRQLLLLGAMLDFSDTINRKVASSFVQELLFKPLDCEDADDDGNKIIIGDGISLGGDREWARAVSELAKKVHTSVGEFETVVTSVVEDLTRPCRERTADFMQWMHCLAVTGLLLENIVSLRSLRGKAIEPSELLHSLLLPGAKQIHVDVQRVATRCLCLFGLLERTLSEDLVKQLRLSFINGPAPVSVMASKALIDLAMWHGPHEVDKAIRIDLQNSDNDEKDGFNLVNLSNLNDDVSVRLLDLLYSGLYREDWIEDDQESVHAIIGEGFAKILLLSENYASMPSSLHPAIFCRLVSLYFSDESNDLQRLKQCLSVFFEHYTALSYVHKECVSKAFIPVIQSMWPGIYGNSGGSNTIVAKLRKRAVQASHFMLQKMQMPLFSNESEEQQVGEKNSESVSTATEPALVFESSEEGLAIRIAAEIIKVANSPQKKTAAEKAYMLALCRIAVLIQFRTSEQATIKCMRGLLNSVIASASSDKDLVKELSRMAAHLKSLDKQPDQDLSQEQADAIFEKLGLDGYPKIDTSSTVLPPTPAPRSTRAVASRRRVRRVDSDEDDEESSPAPAVPMTPSVMSVRSQRASKTAAMSKITTKTTIEFSDEDIGDESDVTSEDTSDDACDD